MPTKTKTSRPTAAPNYVNAEGLADALGISKRQAAKLRHEPWFPAALVLGPRSLRFDLNEVYAAMKRHAPRARVGAEPAQLASSRERAAHQ